MRLIPYVAEENIFALKGGTAINMFLWDMPRLSVDIDLTYVNFDDRQTAMQNIAAALIRIKTRLEKNITGIKVRTVSDSGNNDVKLESFFRNAAVKIEVNTSMRGTIYPTFITPLSQAACERFDVFSEMRLMSVGEIMGGKICAALDRQHPRDLFDIQNLFLRGGITEEIKEGFIAALLSNNRPIFETLSPRLNDQRKAFANQFNGMTAQAFSYSDFELVREKLFNKILTILTDRDKRLLLSIKAGEPDWSLSNIEKLKELPAVRWKLQNILKLQKENPSAHRKALQKLEAVLVAK